jgi:hypothetical protein
MQNVASASEMTLPNEIDETFWVTGDTTIDFIDSTGRSHGNRIQLIFNDNPGSITQNAYGATPSDPKFKKLYWNGTENLDSQIDGYQVLALVLSAAGWHVINLENAT